MCVIEREGDVPSHGGRFERASELAAAQRERKREGERERHTEKERKTYRATADDVQGHQILAAVAGADVDAGQIWVLAVCTALF